MEKFLRSVDDTHNLKLFNSYGSNSFRTLEVGKMPSSNDILFNAKLIRDISYNNYSVMECLEFVMP